MAEDFADAGRLLVRLPVAGQDDQPELQAYAGGQHVQSIPTSGQQAAGLAGFELARAADTVAAYGRAELALKTAAVLMPVGYVRPRTLASGVDIADDRLVLRDAATVDGLTAAVFLAYAPWRPPMELPITADGSAALPPALVEAGPLNVLLRVDDPWAVANWPTWPDSAAYACQAPGVPTSPDPEERDLSMFVAGHAELPALTDLGRLWRLVNLAADLARLGARTDLAAKSTAELLRRPRAALLSLGAEDLSNENVVHALISTGLAAAPAATAPWTPTERKALERLWAAYPAAAAIASGASLASPEIADLAESHCGDSLSELLAGRPDPHAVVGRFGPEAEQMALWSPDQVEAPWQAAAVVPQALLGRRHQGHGCAANVRCTEHRRRCVRRRRSSRP